jgi:hypothetical protein
MHSDNAESSSGVREEKIPSANNASFFCMVTCLYGGGYETNKAVKQNGTTAL